MCEAQCFPHSSARKHCRANARIKRAYTCTVVVLLCVWYLCIAWCDVNSFLLTVVFAQMLYFFSASQLGFRRATCALVAVMFHWKRIYLQKKGHTKRKSKNVLKWKMEKYGHILFYENAVFNSNSDPYSLAICLFNLSTVCMCFFPLVLLFCSFYLSPKNKLPVFFS